MESLIKDNKQGLQILGFFLLVSLLIMIWQWRSEMVISSNGVYTKCIIKSVLAYKGGVRIEIDYFFKNEKFSALLNYSGDGIKVGEQYFIKLLPENPKAFNFDNIIIPECLLNKQPPFNGWTKLPTCDNY